MTAAPQDPSRPRVLVAQIGARRHYAVPRILLEAGLLERLHTDLLGQGTFLDRILRPFDRTKGARRLRGRSVAQPLFARTTEHRGMGAEFALRRALPFLSRRSTYLWAGSAFARTVARGGFGAADTVYGYTEGSLELLEAARQAGIATMLDQFIVGQPIRDELLREEIERYPDWQSAAALSPVAPEMYERVRAEWEAADRILCPSSHVRDSLTALGVSAAKLTVVPFGIRLPSRPAAPREAGGRHRLRVLFAGSVELRKGVQYLAEALDALSGGGIETRIAGNLRIAEAPARRLSRRASILGPVPRPEMDRLYDWTDVLVLPSLVEGSAMVTYEALGRGIPVVCTDNAGSVVIDGTSGIIVPARDSGALAAALDSLASSKATLAELRDGARRHVELASIERYGRDLVESITGLRAGGTGGAPRHRSILAEAAAGNGQ